MQKISIVLLLFFFIPHYNYSMRKIISREQLLALAPAGTNGLVNAIITTANNTADKAIFECLFCLAQHDQYNETFNGILKNNQPQILEMKNNNGETLFHAATYGIRPSKKNLFTLLVYVQEHAPKHVKNLLQARDTTGETALHNAIKMHNLTALEYLLKAGAPITNVKRGNKKIRSAVHLVLSDIPRPTVHAKSKKKQYYKHELMKKKQYSIF